MGGNSKKNSKVELVDLEGIRKRIKKIKSARATSIKDGNGVNHNGNHQRAGKTD